jgi:CHAT domain-containing protein
LRRGDLKAAQAVIDDALVRFAGSKSDALWSLRVLRGEVLNGLANCREAEQYISAIDLPERLRRQDVAVNRFLALATAQSRCADSPAAKVSLQRAERIARQHRRALLGSVLARKADLEISAHDWRSADRDLRELIPLARRTADARIEARAWATLARLRGQQERFDEAIDANERALTIAQSSNDSLLALVIRLNLGWLRVDTGDYDAAIATLVDVDAESARLGRKNDRVTALLQLGNAYYAQDQFARAGDYYRRALAIARQLNSRSVEYLVANLARVELAAKNYEAAQKFNDEALELKKKLGDREAELRSVLINAQIAQGLGRPDEAERLYKSVIESAKSKSLQWLASGELAMFYAEARRGEQADALFRGAAAGADEAWSDLKSEELRLSFPSVLSGFYNAYVQFLIENHREAEALEVAELSRARALSERIEVGQNLDARRIAKDRKAVALSYWLAPTKSYLWVVTPTAITTHALPAAPEIAESISAYQRDLLGPRGNLEGSGARGQELWNVLVGPAANAIGTGTRVIIIPDKQLHGVNFETLVVSSPRPHYWIEDVTITTAPSLRLLARARSSTNTALLLVGNPPQSDPALPPLPRAAAEIERVRAHFGNATVLQKAQATPRAYESAVPRRFGFIHFVAHGTASRLRPLDSAVILAGDPSGYKLYARDILRYPLNARLVTVSSCYGAGQRAYAGEGLVGLAWAFLRAGARDVVAALWEVSDNATPELMDAMYARIRSGDDPATALRAAKLRLLRSNGVYRKPLYWAPFMLYSGA